MMTAQGDPQPQYTGPGEIYLQSRNLKAFVDAITRFLPKPSSSFGT